MRREAMRSLREPAEAGAALRIGNKRWLGYGEVTDGRTDGLRGGSGRRDCGRVHPETLACKGIRGQRDAAAIFIGIEGVPIDGETVLPEGAESKENGGPLGVVLVRVREGGNRGAG